MSFHYYLYSAPKDVGPINRWEKNEAEPIGSPDEVKEQIASLYPQIEWERCDADGWSGLGRGTPYLDVFVTEDEPGVVFFIVLNKAVPSVMRRVMESLGLNSVCAPEAGDLVDPYAYEDDDLYYKPRVP